MKGEGRAQRERNEGGEARRGEHGVRRWMECLREGGRQGDKGVREGVGDRRGGRRKGREGGRHQGK